MIPKAYITEWRNFVPWKSNEQVEQDLVICRALVEIFNDDFLRKSLAFRGGTAVHKLYLNPQPRYSEDIDLVQINPEPIKETIMRIQEKLAFLGKADIRQKRANNTLTFRFESEFAPVQPLRLKIEINCREHFKVFEFVEHKFEVESEWFDGNCKILTYELEELLGTKLRALYQRKKGRDLYDLYKAFQIGEPDSDKIIETYHKYMNFSVENPPTQKQFLINMEDKIEDAEFLGDTTALLRPTEKYDDQAAYELIRKKLIEKI
ncbi:nucleotidyl transferase AbiEii/AbiGii toxin family protein [soil metagenome]